MATVLGELKAKMRELQKKKNTQAAKTSYQRLTKRIWSE